MFFICCYFTNILLGLFSSRPSRVLSLFLCKVASQRIIQSHSGDVVTLGLNPRFVCAFGISPSKFKMSNCNQKFAGSVLTLLAHILCLNDRSSSPPIRVINVFW